MKSSLRFLLAAFIAALGTSARAQSYTFTNVADNNGGQFFNFGTSFGTVVSDPALNDAGTMAFFATTNAGNTAFGLFTKNGPVVTTIATNITAVSGGTISSFGGLSGYASPSINATGRVAFMANVTGNASGVYSGAGGALTVIADSNTPGSSIGTTGNLNAFGGRPSINSAGAVAFTTQAGTAGLAKFVLSGTTNGLYNVIATNNGNFGTFSSPTDATSIGPTGRVSFQGFATDVDLRLWSGAGGALTNIAGSGGQFSSFGSMGGSTRPKINALDNVLFIGQLTAGGDGVFRGNGGSPITIADSSGPYSDFGVDPSMNDANAVAFYATLDAGGSGIYTGANPVTNKVIQTGDPLFGSTVTAVSMGSYAINNLGQVGFAFNLADGRMGIAIATPTAVPEPSSLLFAGTAAAGLFWRRRGSQRR